MPIDDGYSDGVVAQAEATLIKFGQGRVERLRFAIEEAYANQIVLSHLADFDASDDEGRLIEALQVVMDRLYCMNPADTSERT